MKNYIMGFITAVSLTVGVSSAYYNSTSLQNMQGTDLYDIIYAAVDDAMKNHRR